MKRKLFNRISLSTMVILGVIPALGSVQTVCAISQVGGQSEEKKAVGTNEYK